MPKAPPNPHQSQAHTSAPPQPNHTIWLAGLGAMAQAQAQGTQVFERLVSDGLAFQRQAQQEAQQHMTQASQRMDKLEHVFEDRVARALQRLGMPTLQDVAQLHARVAAMEAQLTAWTAAAAPASAKARAKPTAKTRIKATATTASSPKNAAPTAPRGPRRTP